MKTPSRQWNRWAGLLLALGCVALLPACYLPDSPTVAPLASDTPVDLPQPTATVPPSPTVPPHTPTPPLPTIDPAAVRASIAAAEARVAERGVESVCLAQRDTDLDDGLEWIGLYVLPSDPPQLLGFVLDGDAWHDLAPPPNDEYTGLGEYATCDLQVRDVNVDGIAELLIWGHASGDTDYLHVFAFADDHYALLGAFEGKGGIHLENTDGDLVEEVVVRLQPQGDLVQEIVYTWDGNHYAWTWDRYAWFYLNRPHAYRSDTPAHAVISFYLALNDRDLPAAYDLLTAEAQSGQPYDSWVDGFATTLQVEVGVVQTVSEEGGQATVGAQVIAMDNEAGRILARLYDVTWQLVETEQGWRLASGEAEMPDPEPWEVPYYP